MTKKVLPCITTAGEPNWQKEIEKLKGEKENILSDYGKNNKIVKQLVDLALLSNNMLKGEQLTSFIKRSVDLIKK